MTRLLIGFLLLLGGMGLGSCQKQNLPKDALYQVNSFKLFAQGFYDGFYSYEQIKSEGDFGIGTFDRLNGEMVMIDGIAYRIEANGTAVEAPDSETAPVATYCSFDPEIEFNAQNLDLEQIKQEILAQIPDTTLFYAIRIDAEIETLLSRSIYAQEKPYRQLLDVLQEEVRMESQHIAGSLVGFWAPGHLSDPLWSGFHFHFISADRKIGGHVLDGKLIEAQISIDQKEYLNLILNK